MARVTWDLPYGEPTSLDWLHAGAFSENTVLANLCESLLRVTPDLGAEPALARAVEHPSPTRWGYAKPVFARAYARLPDHTRPDVATARRLLKAAGPQRELRAAVNGDDVAAKEIAAYVQSVARGLGLRMRVTSMPTAQLVATLFDPGRQRRFDLLVNTSNYYDVAEPLELAVLALKAGGPFNVLGYADRTVERLITRAQRESDPARRARLLTQIETRTARDWITVPLVNYASRLFMNRRITGAPASMTAYLYRPWGADLGAAAAR